MYSHGPFTERLKPLLQVIRKMCHGNSSSRPLFLSFFNPDNVCTS